jgi:hypothetical protein
LLRPASPENLHLLVGFMLGTLELSALARAVGVVGEGLR